MSIAMTIVGINLVRLVSASVNVNNTNTAYSIDFIKLLHLPLLRGSQPKHKPPKRYEAHCMFGADVPSDQCVTGTMITLKASGESWNCGFSIGGAPGRSAPHVEPCARGK